MIKQSLWLTSTEPILVNEDINTTYNLSPIVSRLLAKRGVVTMEAAKQYFSDSWDDLYNPFLLFGMESAVDRIKSAIQDKERIVIYGDYDVDGITSTALMMKTLTFLKADVQFYLPDRMEEGYGLNSEALHKLSQEGAKLVITVDCGISAVEQGEAAKELGLDLIITDHHECQETLPSAYAIINPKQSGCQYPEKYLAGAGIAFKLAQGLLGDEAISIQYELIALAALGTIADLAPLKGENRLIAKLGLKAINDAPSEGIRALIQCAGIKAQTITAGHVGFQIGPRLNASGRLEKAHIAVELLMSSDAIFCNTVATELNHLNQSRQTIEAEIVEKCIERVDQLVKDKTLGNIIVLKDPDFHVGVVGIAASRLVERYQRPVILMNEENGFLKGSARSVGDFNIFDAIHATEKHIIHFGGHKQAAGLKLTIDNFENFVLAINTYTNKTIQATDLIPRVQVEQVLSSQDVTLELADAIEKLEPFGMGNPKPIFSMRQLILEGVNWMGADKNHVKMVLNQSYRMFEAIQFRTRYENDDFKLHEAIDLAFYIEKNQFRAVETLQLHIKDIRFKNMLHHEDNVLILAYFSSFLDYLSSEELPLLTKQDLKSVKVMGERELLSQGIQSQRPEKSLALFTVHAALNLYFEGNAEATEWTPFLENQGEKRLLLCPSTDDLKRALVQGLIVVDAPLSVEALQMLKENGHTLYLDPYGLKKQLTLLDYAVLERTQLADYYKLALKTFEKNSFNYSDWITCFEPDRFRSLFALRLLVDGGIIKTSEEGLLFKDKPEKMSVYELQIMKNIKNYRHNLKVAIDYCESNKLL